MDVVIRRNTFVTNIKQRKYVTAVDNQTTMTIKVMLHLYCQLTPCYQSYSVRSSF